MILESVMLRSTLLFLLLAMSAAAGAEDFNYNYVWAGFGTIDFDGVDADGDGFTIGGSFAISDSVHVFAGYETADLDFRNDANTWNAGIGYNTSVSDSVDLIAKLSYEYVEIDAPLVSGVDDNGLGLGVGLRFAASEAVELNAGIDYVDYSDGGDDTSFVAGGRYNFTDAFSVGLDGRWGDDISRYAISGRYYFGL
jgi:opacity protein-like surface antigen